MLLLPKAKRLLADYEQMIAEAPDGMAMEGEVSSAHYLRHGPARQCLVPLKKLHTAHIGQTDDRPLRRSGQPGPRRKLDAALLIETARQNFDGLSWTMLYNEPIVMPRQHRPDRRLNDAVELLRTQPFIRYDRSTAVGRKVQSIIKSDRSNRWKSSK